MDIINPTKKVYFGDKFVCVSEYGCIDYGRGIRCSTLANEYGLLYVVLPFNRQGLYANGTRHYIHRLVATAFVHNPDPNNEIVIHIDGNRKNNYRENLRWGKRSEACSKKIVYKYNIGGEYTNECFDSAVSASKSISSNVTGGVSSCCTGMRPSWKGYEWSHMNPEDYKIGRSGIMEKCGNHKIIKEPVRKAKKVYKYHIGGRFTGECFENTFQACMSFSGVTSVGSISACFNGRLRHWKGYEWSYEEHELYMRNREERMEKCKKYRKFQYQKRSK